MIEIGAKSGAAAITIGDSIVGSTPNAVLYVDAGGKLANSSNFLFDNGLTIVTNGANQTMTLSGNRGIAHAGSIVLNDTSGSATTRNWLIANSEYQYGQLNFRVSAVAGGVPSIDVMTLHSNGVCIGGTNTVHRLEVISNGSLYTYGIGLNNIGGNISPNLAMQSLAGYRYIRQNNLTLEFVDSIGHTTAVLTDDGRLGTGGILTPTAFVVAAASTVYAASLRIHPGVAPTTPNAGDVWFDGSNFLGYNGSTTVILG